MSRLSILSSIALVAIGSVTACTDDAGTGTIHVTAWGEEAAVDGFPNAELSFADGWTIAYDNYVVSFGDVELGDPGTERVAGAVAGPFITDFHRAIDPVDVADLELPAGRYKVSFSTVPASAAATRLGTVDDAIVTRMTTNHWNLFVKGRATKGAVTVTFSWGFTNAGRYQYCVNGVDDTDGVAVGTGGTVEAGLFFHVDHLYWDRLGTEEAELRFDVPAAWADPQGDINLEALTAVTTANPRDRDGAPVLNAQGQPVVYDDAGLGLTNLKDFIVFSNSKSGHLNGEGQCTLVH